MADRQVIADFARSMGIATSGLRAQAGRMRVISENIANADSTAATAGGDPYRRKVPSFSSTLHRTLDAKGVTRGRLCVKMIAPADPPAAPAGGDPYRRKVPSFSSTLDRTLDAKVVTIGRI